ncbi:MAG: hypothetical protein H0V31_03120 [Acidobacteria bacterium]|nr:hypothetical protein [Acidobacteriota bacterium]
MFKKINFQHTKDSSSNLQISFDNTGSLFGFMFQSIVGIGSGAPQAVVGAAGNFIQDVRFGFFSGK